MPFSELRTDPPQGLTTDEFVLRPITVADTELDYEAVMESRDYLRAWEQSTWPADDFTVAANREDLDMLERRHNDGAAFTYTVMNPPGTECLGCVYFMAPNARSFTEATITPIGDRRWEDYEATVYFWVRRSRLATDTDRTLLDALRSWLRTDWSFRGHLFITNEQFTQQVEMFGETDLELRFEIDEPNKPGRYLAYE